MKKRNGTILIITLLAIIIGLSIYESDVWKTQRKGIDEQIMADVLEITEIIDWYHNELEYNYDEVYESDRAIIDNFRKNKYIDDNEKASEEESKLLAETTLLISQYLLHNEEVGGEIKDYGTEINESIGKIREIIHGH